MATGKDKAFLQPGRLIDLDQEMADQEGDSRGQTKAKGKPRTKTRASRVAAKQMSMPKGRKTIYKSKGKAAPKVPAKPTPKPPAKKKKP
tara:strand:- start:1516 stop:1782 length:267 start_codon:yes stop_codon:yes gene_type:complete